MYYLGPASQPQLKIAALVKELRDERALLQSLLKLITTSADESLRLEAADLLEKRRNERLVGEETQ